VLVGRGRAKEGAAHRPCPAAQISLLARHLGRRCAEIVGLPSNNTTVIDFSARQWPPASLSHVFQVRDPELQFELRLPQRP